MPIPRQNDLVNSLTTTEAPSSLQNRFEYNGDGTVLYAGYAPRSVSSSDEAWTIFKYTYNVSQQVTLKQTAFSNWDNRALAEYA